MVYCFENECNNFFYNEKVSRKAHLMYCSSDYGVISMGPGKGSRTSGLHIAAGWHVPPMHIKLVIVVEPSGHLIMPSPWHPPGHSGRYKYPPNTSFSSVLESFDTLIFFMELIFLMVLICINLKMNL